MNELLKIAMAWLVQGFATIPIGWRSKRPHAQSLPRDENGDPKWESYQTTLPTEYDLARWFPPTLRNGAIVMGWNDLVVVDFDLWDAYVYWRQRCTLQTYEVKTRRGMHVYISLGEKINNLGSDFLDIKAHGYVLIPPSVHPSGHQYTIYNDAPIARVEKLADILPTELIPATERLTEYKPIKIEYSEGDVWDALDNPYDCGENLVDQIRQRHPILDFFPKATTTSRGKEWYKAACPFHDDQTPSFWINTQKQICGCYVCRMLPMDVINLTARLYGISNKDAILYLLKA